MYVGLLQLNNRTNTQIPLFYERVQGYPSDESGEKLSLSHPCSRLGGEGWSGIDGVEGSFPCAFSGSCVSAVKFESCRFGTQIFISKLFLALKFTPIKSVFLASRKRVDPSLWSPLSSPLSNCVALGKSFHSHFECVTIFLSEKNKVTAFPRLPRSKWLALCPTLSILWNSYSTWGRCSGNNVRMTSWEDLRSRGTFFQLRLQKPFDYPSRGGVLLCV